MKIIRSKCPLCLNVGEIQESHLLPKSVYKAIRKESEPILITADISRYTSKQLTKRLLCADCEQRFSSRGEQYVLEHFLREKNDFLLLNKLHKLKPIAKEDNNVIYQLKQADNIDLPRFIYFALSVYWRGSVTNWKYDYNKSLRSYLGKKYQEALRLYLMDEIAFPNKMTLHMFVDHSKLFRTAIPPYRFKKEAGYQARAFSIHGIFFLLYLGNTLPEGFRGICANYNKIVFATDIMYSSLMKGPLDLFRLTKRSIKLLK